MAPVAHAGRDLVAGLEDQGLEPALEQVGGGGEADRSRADDGDGQVRGVHGLPQQQRLGVDSALGAQPQPSPPVDLTSASSAQQAPLASGAGPPQQPAGSAAPFAVTSGTAVRGGALSLGFLCGERTPPGHLSNAAPGRLGSRIERAAEP